MLLHAFYGTVCTISAIHECSILVLMYDSSVYSHSNHLTDYLVLVAISCFSILLRQSWRDTACCVTFAKFTRATIVTSSLMLLCAEILARCEGLEACFQGWTWLSPVLWASSPLHSDYVWTMGLTYRTAYTGPVVHLNNDLASWLTHKQYVIVTYLTDAEHTTFDMLASTVYLYTTSSLYLVAWNSEGLRFSFNKSEH